MCEALTCVCCISMSGDTYVTWDLYEGRGPGSSGGTKGQRVKMIENDFSVRKFKSDY